MNDKDIELGKAINKFNGYTYVPDYFGYVLNLDAVKQLILAKTISFGVYTGDYKALMKLTGVTSNKTIYTKLQQLEEAGYILKKTFFVEGTKLRCLIVSLYTAQWERRSKEEVDALIQRGIQNIQGYYDDKKKQSKTRNSKPKKVKKKDIKVGDVSSSNSILEIEDFTF